MAELNSLQHYPAVSPPGEVHAFGRSIRRSWSILLELYPATLCIATSCRCLPKEHAMDAESSLQCATELVGCSGARLSVCAA